MAAAHGPRELEEQGGGTPSPERAKNTHTHTHTPGGEWNHGVCSCIWEECAPTAKRNNNSTRERALKGLPRKHTSVRDTHREHKRQTTARKHKQKKRNILHVSKPKTQ